jgi:hypothetical protein
MRIVLLLVLTSTVIAQPAVIDIKPGESQLFVDDFLIESQSSVTRTLHQPAKEIGGNLPVLTLDKEFDVPATLEANGTIVYDRRGSPRVATTTCETSNATRMAPSVMKFYRIGGKTYLVF